MMIKLVVIFVFITCLDAARILAVFPTPSRSHQVVFRPITQELAKRGHELVVITPDPAFTKESLPANITEIDVHDISYETWNEEFFKLKIGSENLFSHVRIGLRLFIKVFEMQMKVKEVQDLIKSSKHFDLLLLEACIRPTLAFSHVFKSPVIQISSLGAMYGTFEIAGAPSHPFLYPSLINQRHYNLTIWEKIREFYSNRYVENLYQSMELEENEVIKNIFGPDVSPLNELYNNIDMFFLNVDPVWANNQPIPPNILYIGGIHQKPRNGLPEDLQSFLDFSNNDVIYVSFGTNVCSSQVPSHVVQAMVEVFSQLKYNILWKWDDDQMEISKNVKIYKWVPQMDVLLHPKVKLFITQGGLQSTQEAIEAGVPLIGIPTIGDQWYNVEKYVYHKIGVKLEMQSLTVESFKNTILTVIQDESYSKNIMKLRNVMYDHPQSPLERAIWWIEYVLRNGGAKHLRAPAANMSYAEYYELELIGILLTGFLITFVMTCLIVKFIWQLIWRIELRKIKSKIT